MIPKSESHFCTASSSKESLIGVWGPQGVTDPKPKSSENNLQ